MKEKRSHLRGNIWVSTSCGVVGRERRFAQQLVFRPLSGVSQELDLIKFGMQLFVVWFLELAFGSTFLTGDTAWISDGL
jgi:hypothetical protein